MRRVVFALVLGVFLALPLVQSAAAFDPFAGFKSGGGCDSSAKDAVVCNTDGKDPISGTDGILRKVTSFIALLAGIVAVILIIIAGFQFVTSGGDAGKVANARNALIGALVGILIVVFAQAILVYVLKAT